MDKEAQEIIYNCIHMWDISRKLSLEELVASIWRELIELGCRKLPKDKPPIIALDELFGNNKDLEAIQQAQREADIRWYEENR